MRISDTVSWHPLSIADLPPSSATDALCDAIDALSSAIDSYSKRAPDLRLVAELPILDATPAREVLGTLRALLRPPVPHHKMLPAPVETLPLASLPSTAISSVQATPSPLQRVSEPLTIPTTPVAPAPNSDFVSVPTLTTLPQHLAQPKESSSDSSISSVQPYQKPGSTSSDGLNRVW